MNGLTGWRRRGGVEKKRKEGREKRNFVSVGLLGYFLFKLLSLGTIVIPESMNPVIALYCNLSGG